MRINPIELTNKSKLISDYRTLNEQVLGYFDYSPFNHDVRRLNDINNHTYNREGLVEALQGMNRGWDAPQNTFKQIDRLRSDNSVVVIGGQQAGIATGPLYTINKIISIIQLARKKEKELQIPVIPVFWIAGEDHDYDEINHVFVEKDNTMKKLTTYQQLLIKKSITHIKLDQDKTLNWLQQLFLSFHETEYTKTLYENLLEVIEKSHTFVDFFARIIFHLFKEEGLVLIDSAHPNVRALESDMFTQLIKKQEPLAQAVFTQVDTLKQQGYSIPLDVDLDDTHLFYHDEQGERILLKRQGDLWAGKNDEVQFTTEELIGIAKQHPNQLSNNVISRPIMQEYLFPTLAFVAGDGEISYWAALKKAFHLFDLYVPPVIPRLSFTFVNAKTETLLKERNIPVAEAINDGVGERKVKWLHSQQNPPIPIITTAVKKEFEKIHEPLRVAAKSISDDLHLTAERNLQVVYRDIEFLENKILHTLEEQYKVELERYEYIDNMLRPNGVLQERIWNPLPFINYHGSEFITELVKEDCLFENDHYVVYI